MAVNLLKIPTVPAAPAVVPTKVNLKRLINTVHPGRH